MSSWSKHAACWRRAGDLGQAKTAYGRVVELTGDDPNKSRMIRSRVAALINLAQMDDDPARAEARLKQGLELLERKGLGDNELRLPLQMNLTAVLSRQNKDAEASALIERTLVAAERHYSAHDPWLG